MEENKENNSLKEAFGTLVADLRIFKIAFQRLWNNIVNLIKCIDWSCFANLLHLAWLKWALAALAVIIVIIFMSRSCSGSDVGTDDAVEDSIAVVESMGFTSRVERPAVAHRLGSINYKRAFNDLNDTHMAVAKKIGVKPLQSREDAANAASSLVDITTDNAYVVDELTHSVPFLIPEAAALLKRIGENFQDSLVMKHLPPHKVIVTSVLRTKNDVKKLRKGNVNSSENSVHCFGTTIDISYKRFFSADGETTDNQAKLKLVLGEVLRDLKKQGYCYVKHENKQACFHITVRKAPK